MKEIRQKGEYSYVYSRYREPIEYVNSGETVAIYTKDAFENRIKSESDLPGETLGKYVNPQTGPIYIKNAEPGDTLQVKVKAIEPTRDHAISALRSEEYTSELQSRGHLVCR